MARAEIIRPYGRIRDTRELIFGSSTYDVLFTLASLGAGAGRVSDIIDLGACRPWIFSLEPVNLEWASAPAAAEYIGLWAVGGDDTTRDGGLGIVDGAVSSLEQLTNCKNFLGATRETGTSAISITSIPFRMHVRYLQLAVWNYSAAVALDSDATLSWITLKAHAVR